MAGGSYKGWTRGGSVETVKGAVLIIILLVIDGAILAMGLLEGKMPAPEVMIALVALNIVVLGLVGHWSVLAKVRKGLWTKTYPLSETTVLDSVEGYLDRKGLKFKAVGEEHTYTENYSDVLQCLGPAFEIKLRPVGFPQEGVAVLAGPEDKKNQKVLWSLMDELDDVLEEDLKEGIRRVSPKNKKNKEEEE